MLPDISRQLLPAPNSVRLVQMLPGQPGTDMHCRLIDHKIRDDRVSGLKHQILATECV